MSEPRPSTGPLFIPKAIHEHDKHDGMISTGENSCFIIQSSLAVLPADLSSIKARETGEGSNNFFPLELSLSYFEGVLTCRKILRQESDGFTSLPKEDLLPIFIAIKNPSPSAGFEFTNLGFSGKTDTF
jgi:hypothetical protein